MTVVYSTLLMLEYRATVMSYNLFNITKGTFYVLSL